MRAEEEIMPFEREFGKRIASRPLGNCLHANEICELAACGGNSPQYESGVAHILTCNSCRRVLKEFQELESKRREIALKNPALLPVPKKRWITAGSFVLVTALLILAIGFSTRTVEQLKDGGATVRLTAAGELYGLPNMEQEQKSMVVSAMQKGQLNVPSVLNELRPNGDAFRFKSGALEVRAPFSTVIMTPQPEFTWKMPDDAVACNVILESVNDAKTKIKTKPLKEERWKPKKPLTPGGIYSWQVIALNNQGKEVSRVPERIGVARFKVLGEDRAVALEKSRLTFGSSHLVMGILYAQEGMVDYAAREFQELVKANTNSRIPQNLLESVNRMRSNPGVENTRQMNGRPTDARNAKYK